MKNDKILGVVIFVVVPLIVLITSGPAYCALYLGAIFAGGNIHEIFKE